MLVTLFRSCGGASRSAATETKIAGQRTSRRLGDFLSVFDTLEISNQWKQPQVFTLLHTRPDHGSNPGGIAREDMVAANLAYQGAKRSGGGAVMNW